MAKKGKLTKYTTSEDAHISFYIAYTIYLYPYINLDDLQYADVLQNAFYMAPPSTYFNWTPSQLNPWVFSPSLLSLTQV